jgi:predicted membrane channel-forming protein YqfA (hemolysin III family)
MAVESHKATASERSDDSTESEDQRLARNVSELLQELRVAQAGVQFLFGFLLAVAFTEHYARASGFEQVVHLIAVVFATASVALLTAPAAWHRLLFRQGQRREILRVANTLMVIGLVCLAIAMTATVLLLFKVVAGTTIAVVFAVLVAVLFGLLWFVLPLRVRFNGNGNGD